MLFGKRTKQKKHKTPFRVPPKREAQFQTASRVPENDAGTGGCSDVQSPM